MSKPPSPPRRIVNKKARFDYEIIEQVEAGISLTGSEVKSLRAGQASLDEAFGFIREGEMFLCDCQISPYPQAGYVQHVPKRERKLLLHRSEIRKWNAKVAERGFTLIPLAIYFNEDGRAKVEIALCKGKTHGDKRDSLKEREHRREMDRAMRRR